MQELSIFKVDAYKMGAHEVVWSEFFMFELVKNEMTEMVKNAMVKSKKAKWSWFVISSKMSEAEWWKTKCPKQTISCIDKIYLFQIRIPFQFFLPCPHFVFEFSCIRSVRRTKFVSYFYWIVIYLISVRFNYLHTNSGIAARMGKEWTRNRRPSTTNVTSEPMLFRQSFLNPASRSLCKSISIRSPALILDLFCAKMIQRFLFKEIKLAI